MSADNGTLAFNSSEVITVSSFISGTGGLAQLVMDDPERIPLTGKVVWINPRQQGVRAAGFGIQLSGEEGDKARRKIENVLAGSLQADRPTHTM